MVDRSDISDLNAFDLYDAESERVALYFAAIGEDEWSKDTRCEGWRVRELLSHLANVETYHLACLNDTIPTLFEETSKAGVTDVHSFNDWTVRIRADRPREEVLDEWLTKNADVRRRMRELGPDATMASMVGALPRRPHGAPYRERVRHTRRRHERPAQR